MIILINLIEINYLSKVAVLPLYSALVRPCQECFVHFWAPDSSKGKELERVSGGLTNMEGYRDN